MSGIWRPERRNRNIGTAKSGFSKSNDMRIPESWQDKYGNYSIFYERLDEATKQDVVIKDNHVTILYEKPAAGWTYGCSPADVVKIMEQVADWVPCLPDIIAFRQPTRKQSRHNSVWGRFIYYAEIGRFEGPAIVLEAQAISTKHLRWDKRMSVEERAEYERLIADGHIFTETKRRFEAKLTEENIRSTILYRTLLHELGHLVDYDEKVLTSHSALDPNYHVASQLYFSRPVLEREHFAHNFADRIAKRLKKEGKIPFERQDITNIDVNSPIH